MKRMKNIQKKENGITLIALAVTIVVLLILAVVSISMLTGENGIIKRAQESKVEGCHGEVKEAISLAYSEYKLEKATKNEDMTFESFNKDKSYFKEANGRLDTEKLTGKTTYLGNGTDNDIYILKYKNGQYFLNYYSKDNEERLIWSVQDKIEERIDIPEYNEQLLNLKVGDYVVYNSGIDDIGEIMCRVMYDSSSGYGIQIVPCEPIQKNGEFIEVSLGSDTDFEKTKNDYNNGIKILNDEAMKYINPQYVLDARCFGSNPAEKNAENKSTVILEDSITGEALDSGLKDAYKVDSDEEIIEDLGMTDTCLYDNGYLKRSVWRAYRTVKIGAYSSGGDTIGMYFSIGNGEHDDGYNNYSYGYLLMNVLDGYALNNPNYSSIWNEFVERRFLPCFLLRGDLEILSGDGKDSSTAYIFK